MFLFMADDMQAPRDADTPGGIDGADNAARCEVMATDGARDPETGAAAAP